MNVIACTPIPRLLRGDQARKLHDAVSTLQRNDPTLVDVNLVGCIDTEQQATDIIAALSENTMVRSLGLQKNRLGTAILKRYGTDRLATTMLARSPPCRLVPHHVGCFKLRVHAHTERRSECSPLEHAQHRRALI